MREFNYKVTDNGLLDIIRCTLRRYPRVVSMDIQEGDCATVKLKLKPRDYDYEYKIQRI